MNDDEKKTLMLERVRDFEIRKRTDASLKNKAITFGGYERGLGFHIGEIEALCEEMAEDGLIRLGKKYMGPDSITGRRVETTSYGRRFLAEIEQDEIDRIKLIHREERATENLSNPGLSPHGKSVVLTSAALLDSIATYREQLRSNNYLSSEHAEHLNELVEFLDWLYSSVQELILRIPNETEGKPLLQELEVRSWREQYWPKATAEFANYTSPESVAKATVPAVIVLTTSAIGLLLGAGTLFGAAAGAGAGAYIGNTLIGHAKPKELTEKIEDSLESGDQIEQ